MQKCKHFAFNCKKNKINGKKNKFSLNNLKTIRY